MNLLHLFVYAEDSEKYPAGDVLFREGESGDVMYVILEGEVDISVDGVSLMMAGPGDIVGEMALIDANERSATATAKTDCKVIPVDEKKFTFLVQKTPFFSLHVMRVLVERLRKMDRRIRP